MDVYKVYIYEGYIGARKIAAILALKKHLGLSLKESKDWFEAVPRILENQTLEDVEFYKAHFLCEAIIVNNYDRPSNENMREPCEDTKKALAWLETLSEEQKDWVKLIGDWEHPASCYAVVC